MTKPTINNGRRNALTFLGTSVAGMTALLTTQANAAAAAPAAPTVQSPAVSAAAVPSASDAPVQSQEFWGDKDGVKLWVYRKYAGAARNDRPILFLVHGSSYSGKTMFDLSVPERTGYSMMDHFARLGYDVWTMDHEGYGHSSRTKSYSDIASGVDDLKIAMDIIAKTTGQSSAAYFGQSSGALRAAKFSNAFPQHVNALMLDALVWTGEGSVTLAQRRKGLPALQASNVRKVNHAFYSSVFTRDEPGAAEPMLGNVVADAELKYGDTVPNGTYRDMVMSLPVCDPTRIACPTLILRAEHDGIATDEDVMGFYSKLPNADKQMVKMAGLAHTAILGINRKRVYHAMQAFLTMPQRIKITA